MTLRTSHLRFTVTAFVLTLILSLPSTYCAKAPPEFTPEQTILLRD